MVAVRRRKEEFNKLRAAKLKAKYILNRQIDSFKKG